MGGDPIAAGVLAEAGGEPDRVVQAGQADGDIRGGATDVLDGILGIPLDDVDQCLPDEQECRR